MAANTTNSCNMCHKTWDIVSQAERARTTQNGKAGDLLPRCEGCNKKVNHTESRKKRKRQEEDDFEPETAPKLRGHTGLEQALKALMRNLAWTTFEADVDDLKRDAETAKQCALRIASTIYDYTGYKFTFREESENKKHSITTVWLACLQRDTTHQEVKKPCADPTKARDARRMPRYCCDGKLKISIQNESRVVRISLSHLVAHQVYKDITIPQKWRDYIVSNKASTPSKIWLGILDLNGPVNPLGFSQRSVYYFWMQVVSHEWQHAEDPIESAREYLKANEQTRAVKLLELEEEPGTQVIAFTITDFMEFGGWTQSFLTDSTFGVNKQGLELFAGVADIQGEGLPLSFLFYENSGNATEGAKQRVLTSWYEALKRKGIDPEFTLSDKDDSEINAMRAVWPLAKHQLCLWHALKALKRRLAKLKEGLAPYDATAAKARFDFIDSNWLPYSMLSDNEIPEKPPMKPVFAIKLTVAGRLPVFTPSLKVRIPVPKNAKEPEKDKLVAEDDLDDTRSDDGNYWGDQAEIAQLAEDGLLGTEEFDEEEVAMEELQEMLLEAKKKMAELMRSSAGYQSNDDEDAWSSEEEEDDDGSGDWGDDAGMSGVQLDAGRDGQVQDANAKAGKTIPANPKTKTKQKERENPTKSTNREYQFCPHAHRLAIIRLFSRHYNQHPLLPERHGKTRTSDQIYRDAVQEMYLHCRRNNLRDVWAYLWVNWYCPKMWALWARSHYSLAIPRKRTTMLVESLWRNYKRLSMPHHARVSADYSIHLLCKETIPASRQRVSKHTKNNPRAGRSLLTTAEQDALKKSWAKLSASQIKGSYDTDPRHWTCNCGSQKYNAHLLCKHLVQSVPKPHNDWWAEAVRYSVPPFYVVPGVVNPMEPEKITDYEWRTRRSEISQTDLAPSDDAITNSPQKKAATTGLTHPLTSSLTGFSIQRDKRAELREIKQLLYGAWDDIETQGENIDDRALERVQSSLRSLRQFRAAVHEIKHARNACGTWTASSQATWGWKFD